MAVNASHAYAASTSMMLLQDCQVHKKLEDNNYHYTATEDIRRGSHCLGYFDGFGGFGNALDHKFFCLPRDATLGQLALVFVAWADRHPEKLHEVAAICAAAALIDAFPCPAKQ